MRRLELQAGAARWQSGRRVWSTNDAMRHAERELALQAQRAYVRSEKQLEAIVMRSVSAQLARGQ